MKQTGLILDMLIMTALFMHANLNCPDYANVSDKLHAVPLKGMKERASTNYYS